MSDWFLFVHFQQFSVFCGHVLDHLGEFIARKDKKPYGRKKNVKRISSFIWIHLIYKHKPFLNSISMTQANNWFPFLCFVKKWCYLSTRTNANESSMQFKKRINKIYAWSFKVARNHLQHFHNQLKVVDWNMIPKTERIYDFVQSYKDIEDTQCANFCYRKYVYAQI